MEPELALLMGNLARCWPQKQTSQGTASYTVLDPCCGGGGLLLPAAILATGCSLLMGPRSSNVAALDIRLVGYDPFSFTQQPKLAESLVSDLRSFGIAVKNMREECGKGNIKGSLEVELVLHAVSVLKWKENFVRDEMVDAIITDPPYGVKAMPVTDAGSAGVLAEHKDMRDDLKLIYRAIVELAAARLRNQGRLVIFVPAEFAAEEEAEGVAAAIAGGKVEKCRALNLVKPLPLGLQVVHVATQTFRGRTFRRTLLVIEKRES